jgi:phosphonate transport system substrate-binding protein
MRHCLLAALTVLATTWAASASAQVDRTGWPAELRFATIPAESDNLESQYGRLFRHIEAQLGVPVRVFRTIDTPAVIVALSSARVEASRMGAEAYVIATRNAPVDALAVEDLPGRGTGYQAGIWVRADSGIAAIEQARGRTMAFGDPSSTSAYLVPMIYFLQELHVRPEAFFARVIFAGDAIPTLQALKNRHVDVAAFSFTMYDVAVERGLVGAEELRPLWRSALIPNPPYVVRTTLPASFRRALQQALVGFSDPEGLAGLPGQPTRLVAATDHDYDGVRQLGEIRRQLQEQPRQ